MIAMPKGPKGEKRPADVIGAAIMVGKIATGEVEERESSGARRKKPAKKVELRPYKAKDA